MSVNMKYLEEKKFLSEDNRYYPIKGNQHNKYFTSVNQVSKK